MKISSILYKNMIIAAAFCISCSSPNKASNSKITQSSNQSFNQSSNHTYIEKKQFKNYNPTILISIPGCRHDFINLYSPINIKNFFLKNSLRVKEVVPIFPTKAITNAIALVTGEYPLSSGVLDDHFFERQLNKEINLNSTPKNLEEILKVEPFWITLEKNGIKTSINQYPGVDIAYSKFQGQATYITNTSFVQQISEQLVPPSKLISNVISQIDQTNNNLRPQFIVIYFPDIIYASMQHGPLSLEVQSAFSEIDSSLGILFRYLNEKEIEANTILLSDHAIHETGQFQAEQLEEFFADIDEREISLYKNFDFIGAGAIIHAYHKNPISNIAQDDIEKLKSVLNSRAEHFKAYTPKDIPEKYHYNDNSPKSSIGDLLLVAESPWKINTVKKICPYKGVSGYTQFKNKSSNGFIKVNGKVFYNSAFANKDAISIIEVHNIIKNILLNGKTN